MDPILERSVYDFSTGPQMLPTKLMSQLQYDMFNYNGSGLGAIELFPRSREYMDMSNHCIEAMRKFLEIPPNYQVLLTQGGSSTQFSAIPMNLGKQEERANYMISGYWSQQSFLESTKFIMSQQVNSVHKNQLSEIVDVRQDGKYFYYCDNETEDGLEFHTIPPIDNMPIVCDMTSSLGTKHIDVSKFGVIFGSPINFAIPGVCVLIVREDLLHSFRQDMPQIMSWPYTSTMHNMPNTPPVFNVFVMGQYLHFLNQTGGIHHYEDQAHRRMKLIYNSIDGSHHFYQPNVQNLQHRSRLNIRFTLPTEELEEQFIMQAKAEGLLRLKSHLSHGGLSINMYNATPVEGVEKLSDFMDDFIIKMQ